MRHVSSPLASILALLAGWAAFHLAYAWPAGSWLLIVYLGCALCLAHAGSARCAFYLGLIFGFGIIVPQLWFFSRIFGLAAVPLWSILALWIALFMLTANRTLRHWPRAGLLLVPVLWVGFEYARSELYVLRFAWVTPGLGLQPDSLLPIDFIGTYGFSGLVLTVLGAAVLLWQRQRVAAAVCATALAGGTGLLAPAPLLVTGPVVTGVQLEFADEDTTLKALDKAYRLHPETDLFVLSEYAFQGPIPTSAREWCRQHGVHLVAGGKAPLPEAPDRYTNTAFVIAPAGEIVFTQGKSVPIQFFDDGEPASQRRLWHSPWGKIGIAICYDLSYTRVMDDIVRQGAEALIIPTMDVAEWGAYQHHLHGRIAPLRAREYGLPIVRVASSGISLIVSPHGALQASAPFPGQGDVLSSRLQLSSHGRLPLDRFFAPLCSLISLLVIGILLASRWRRHHIEA